VFQIGHWKVFGAFSWNSKHNISNYNATNVVESIQMKQLHWITQDAEDNTFMREIDEYI
jgi:hypothetical protein